MRLRVPGFEIEHVTAAVWLRLVTLRISSGKRAEGAQPTALKVQAERVVQSVAGFVAQDAHALDVGAAFDFQHLLALEFHQSRMREIKRNCKTGHAVGREPLSRQPDVRLEANAAIVQLAVETLDVRFEKGSLNTYRQIANANVEQTLIRNQTPFESRGHRRGL